MLSADKDRQKFVTNERFLIINAIRSLINLHIFSFYISQTSYHLHFYYICTQEMPNGKLQASQTE